MNKHHISRLSPAGLGLLAVLTGCLLALNAPATSPPDFMNYQGYLLDANGLPLANTKAENYTVEFRIYDRSSGGTALWGESQIVTVSRGTFSVVLGEGSNLSGTDHTSLAALFKDSTDRFIGITVVSLGSEIAPRLRLLPSPYAFYATHAERATHADSATTANLATQATTATTANNATHLGGQAATEYVRKNEGSTISRGVTFDDGITIRKAGEDAMTFDAVGNVTVRRRIHADVVDGFGTMPLGGIIMWSGAYNAIPVGWALCNGQTANGFRTPDLQNRFIMGAGGRHNPGDTGGSETQQLSVANLPRHSHSVDDAFFSEALNFGAPYKTVFGNNWPGLGADHDFDNNLAVRTINTGETGEDRPFSIIPPYYALAFIMRVR